MPQQIIFIGTQPSDGSGDPLRSSFDKINQNFTEVYTALDTWAGNVTIPTAGVNLVAGKSGNVILTTADIVGLNALINQSVTNAVDTNFNQIIDAAPGALNTLQELADAVQNDPYFATTIFEQLSYKVPKTGATMTGPLYLPTDPIGPLQAATKQYVDNKTAINGANLASLTTTVNSKESIANVAAFVTTLTSSIYTKANSSTVTSLQGNVTSLTSLVNTKADANVVTGIQGNVTSLTSLVNTKANLLTTYSKAEVDAIILNITTTGILTNDWGLITDPVTSTDDFGSII